MWMNFPVFDLVVLSICVVVYIGFFYVAANQVREANYDLAESAKVFGAVLLFMIPLHLGIVLETGLRVTNVFELSLSEWRTAALVVIDTFCRGVFLDLFESFDISVVPEADRPTQDFFMQAITFAFRTGYSAIVTAFGFTVYKAFSKE